MPFLFFAAIALIGAAIHLHRDSQPRSSARTLEIFLVWWMVVAVGVAAIFGAMFHLFDGPHTAREPDCSSGATSSHRWSRSRSTLRASGRPKLSQRQRLPEFNGARSVHGYAAAFPFAVIGKYLLFNSK